MDCTSSSCMTLQLSIEFWPSQPAFLSILFYLVCYWYYIGRFQLPHSYKFLLLQVCKRLELPGDGVVTVLFCSVLHLFKYASLMVLSSKSVRSIITDSLISYYGPVIVQFITGVLNTNCRSCL